MNISLPAHHAVLILHTKRNELFEHFVSEFSQPIHRTWNTTVFDIDSARDIVSWSRTPASEVRYGIITFASATLPAQNAMLKILEEPTNHTRFLLITSNKEKLLPTVLSRLYIHAHTQEKNNTREAKAFLEESPVRRMNLSFVTELLEKTDEEDRKDREAVRLFILSLLDVLHEKHHAQYIHEVFTCASYASDPSASGKAILEYLSLLLPQIK